MGEPCNISKVPLSRAVPGPVERSMSERLKNIDKLRTRLWEMSSRQFVGTSAGGGGETGNVTEASLDFNATMSTESMGQPYFDNTTKRDYTAAVGQPAYLHCRVKNLADRAIYRCLNTIYQDFRTQKITGDNLEI
ncbi:hypothetical protein ACJJTC_016915 [Scirpophaga incertulas]